MNRKNLNQIKKFSIYLLGVSLLSQDTLTQEDTAGYQHKKDIAIEKPKRLERLRKYFELEGSIAFMNDYRWRGVSQTDLHPSVQGELVLKTKYGFYATAWGAYVNFQDIFAKTAHAEIQFGGGNMQRFGDFEYDIGVEHTLYPNVFKEDYTEVFANFTYKPITLGIAFSPSVFNFRNYGLYVFTDFVHELPIPVPLSTRGVIATYHFGSYTFGGSSNKFNYFDFKASLSKVFHKHILLEFAFVSTDGGFTAVRNEDIGPTFVAIMTIVF